MDQKEFNSTILSLLSSLANEVQSIANTVMDLGGSYHEVDWIRGRINELENELNKE